MIKTAALIIIIAIRLLYQPSQAQQSFAPFASQPEQVTGMYRTASLISFNGMLKKNKVILEWIVGENESADMFEIEKSMDGIHYTTAALVFGTDKPDIGKYSFREKASGRKLLYRIKVIGKDKQTTYSSVVEISPAI